MADSKYTIYAKMITSGEEHHRKLSWRYLMFGVLSMSLTSVLAWGVHANAVNSPTSLWAFGMLIALLGLVITFTLGVLCLIVFVKLSRFNDVQRWNFVDFVSSKINGKKLEAEIMATSVSSLLHTLDDYLACVSVAIKVVDKD